MRFFGVSLSGESNSIAPEGPSATQDDHERSITAESAATASIATDSVVGNPIAMVPAVAVSAATDSIATDSIATDSIATDSIATDLIATDLIATDLTATDLIATDLIATDSIVMDSDSSLTDGTIISHSDAFSESDDDHRARSFSLIDADDVVSQSSLTGQLGSESESVFRRDYPQLLNPIQPELSDDCSRDYSEDGKITLEETIEEIDEELAESVDSYCPLEYMECGKATPEEIVEEIDEELAESVDSYCPREYLDCGKATPEEIGDEIAETLENYCSREYCEYASAALEEIREDYSEAICAVPMIRSHNGTPLGSALNVSLQSLTILSAEASPVDSPTRSGANLVESLATSDFSITPPEEADDLQQQSDMVLAESLTRTSRSSSLMALPELLPASLLTDSSMEPLLKRLGETSNGHQMDRSTDVSEVRESEVISDNLATQALQEVESVLEKYATSAGVDAETFASFCQSHVSSRLDSLKLRDVSLVERAPQLNNDSAQQAFEPIREYENDNFMLIAREVQKRARCLQSGAYGDPVVFLRRFVRNEDNTANPKQYRRFSQLVSRRRNETLRKFVMRMIRATSFVPTRDQEDYINIVLPVATVLGLRKHYQFIAADYRKFLKEAPEFYSTQSLLYWFDANAKSTRAHQRFRRFY